jgi:hypothetical protein
MERKKPHKCCPNAEHFLEVFYGKWELVARFGPGISKIFIPIKYCPFCGVELKNEEDVEKGVDYN